MVMKITLPEIISSPLSLSLTNLSPLSATKKNLNSLVWSGLVWSGLVGLSAIYQAINLTYYEEVHYILCHSLTAPNITNHLSRKSLASLILAASRGLPPLSGWFRIINFL